MKCLVTGGAGFLGSHIVDRLCQKGHEVAIIDNLSSGREEYVPKGVLLYKNSVEHEDIFKIFVKEKPDVVFHYAAHIEARESVKDASFDAKVNILGSLNILEACRKIGVKKVIFASSGGEVYGDVKEMPAREDFLPMPVSPYGVAKYAVEKYLYSYSRLFGIGFVALRYGNIYGPRQNPYGESGVVAIFAKRMLSGESIMIHGDGSQTKDYVYIQDAVAATILAMEKDIQGVVNIASGKETSVMEIYTILKEITGFSNGVLHVDFPVEGFCKHTYLSIEKAKKELDWESTVSLRDGIEKTVEWFKHNHDISNSEARKEKEAAFHDAVRDENYSDFSRLTTNKKFYAITRKSNAFTESWLSKMCQGNKVLDYCCGEGVLTRKLAKKGAFAYGIDISPFSINKARDKSVKENLSDKTFFSVMDAEKMDFEDNFFDIVICHGVLHHLDVKKAFPEIARVLKPDGKVICVEPLAYNPIFQLYRKLTPHLRTEWEAEHILTRESINESKKSFDKMETRFFHMFSLAAVPFRNTKIFNPVLSFTEFLDRIFLSLPFVKWWAWQITFILSKPKK